MAELFAKGESPEILFGLAVLVVLISGHKRSQELLLTILEKLELIMPFLGKKKCAMVILHARAGNEFLFQMMAYQNIQVLNNYGIKKS